MKKGRSWKTTLLGATTILSGLTRLYFAVKTGNISEESITSSGGLILGGVGLIFSKDNNVTGGNIESKKNTTEIQAK